jgi:hypothetical protein
MRREREESDAFGSIEEFEEISDERSFGELNFSPATLEKYRCPSLQRFS